MRPLIILENLEERAGRWLIAEYAEASTAAEEKGVELVVSGYMPGDLEGALLRRGVKVMRDASRLFNRPDVVLLDLWAERQLEPSEALSARAFVVGGILGDHPPRGRTRLLYDKYCYAARRNLGPLQLSIDGAVKALLQVLGGKRVEEVELVHPLRFSFSTPLGEVEVELPFAYPVKEGRPWISRELMELLQKGLSWEEAVNLSP
ncbi:MAG: hypothetical protein N3F67_05440 [Acidilobaceae archaeon]|nr:hypothetical protein [Acidilobaceae archaeon]